MTTTEAPPESKIAVALAAFQAELPKVGKENTAQVRSEKGSYQYQYADLADISPEVLPKLARHGLSWTCRPTLTHDGKFVLRYALMHTSGEVIEGDWPLPNPASSSQVLGSAVTYARRYSLAAVTGIAPGGEDDDGAAANSAAQRAAERADRAARSQHPTPAQNGGQRPAQPAAEGETGKPAPAIPSRQVAAALSLLRQTCETNGWSVERVAALYAGKYGHPINNATSMTDVEKFRKDLFSRPDHELKDPENTDA
jgi:hypothetical protein